MKNNIKFACIKICTIYVVLLSFFSNIYVYGDTESNIKYDVSYETSLSVYCTVNNERFTSTDHLGEPFEKNYNVDVTDPTVTADIKRCVNGYIPKIYSYPSFENYVSDRTFTDGYIYKIGESSVRLYSNYFELPENFKGETVIVKEGIPFKLIGDGKGGLSITIKSSGKYETTKSIFMPPIRSHKIEDQLISKFEAYYYPKNMTGSPSSTKMQYFSTNSLEKMIDHLEKNAYTEYKVNISATIRYSYHVVGIVTNSMRLNATYNIPAPNENSINNEVPSKNEMVSSKSETINSKNGKSSSKNESKVTSKKPSSSVDRNNASSTFSSSENSLETSSENLTTSSEIVMSSDTVSTDESVLEETAIKTDDKIENIDTGPIKIVILITLVFIIVMISYFCIVLLKKRKCK